MDLYERVARALHDDHCRVEWAKCRSRRRYQREAKRAVDLTLSITNNISCGECGEPIGMAS